MHLCRCRRGVPTLVVLAATLLLTTTQNCRASLSQFTTATGETVAGDPVNAQVSFNSSAGSMTITITNLQANPHAVTQAISALSFTLSNGNLTGASSNNPTANLINIAGHVGTSAGTGPAGWVFTHTTSTGLLDVLDGTGHAGPEHLIIGPGPYTNANDSINDNDPHNPFIDRTVTFTITGSGISAGTTVSAVTFQFGTQDGSNQRGGVLTPQAVPEPSSVVIALSGLIPIGVMAFRRTRHRPVDAEA
jgi:hypothetical protein